MSKKSRTFIYSTMLTLILLTMTASVVAAAPPLDLHIEVPEFIVGDGEPFYASGGAVDAGMVCPIGTVVSYDWTYSTGNGPYQTLHGKKSFTCTDGSGTFDVKMVVKLNLATGYTTAKWKIISGTGLYAGLKGQGSLVGIPGVPGTILDIYDGKVH